MASDASYAEKSMQNNVFNGISNIKSIVPVAKFVRNSNKK